MRSEIMPDQKQKFLQRYQQTQQGHSAASLLTGGSQISQLSSSSLKHPPGLSAPQANLLQQVLYFFLEYFHLESRSLKFT